MNDERRAAEPAPGDGICAECGGPIPRERLVTLADAFRCVECRDSYETESEPGTGARLKRTA